MSHLVIDEKYSFCYYGSMYENKPPRKGVHYFMLDEHITNKVRIEKDLFVSRMNRLIKKFEEDFLHESKKIRTEIKNTNLRVDDLRKFIGKLAERNELMMPKIEEKKMKGIKKKKKEDDDE